MANLYLRHKIITALALLGLLSGVGAITHQHILSPYHVTAAQQTFQDQTASEQPTQQEADSTVAPVKSQVPGGWHWNGHGAYTIGSGQTGSSMLNNQVNHAPYATNKPVDSLGRATQGDALVNHSSRQYNSREATGEGETAWKPVGFKQSGGPGSYVYNRGHLLAYACVGGIQGYDASESNHANIVTETAWANQAGTPNNTGQNYYEGLVRQAQDNNKTLVYRVQALYSDSELVPRAIWFQARSTDNSVDISVVIPNAQNGVNINYATGDTENGQQQSNQPANNNQNQGSQQGQQNAGQASQQQGNPTNPGVDTKNQQAAQQQANKNNNPASLPATGHIGLWEKFLSLFK